MKKKASLFSVILVVILAAGALVWYLFAAPKEQIQTTNGRIEGTTGYPSEFNPSQRVCAQTVQDQTREFCVVTSEQTSTDSPTFSIAVPPGTYYVYATLRNPDDLGLEENLTAYWTEYVPCGLHVGCKNHEKIAVTVTPGETVTNIQPHDWYANF